MYRLNNCPRCGGKASRNEEGKTVYKVPENATYKDWKDGKYKVKLN